MPSPICVPCGLEMRCEKNEQPIELLSAGSSYQMWSGDKWKCSGCLTEVVVGFARRPFAEHFESKYKTLRAAHEKDLVVVKEWK